MGPASIRHFQDRSQAPGRFRNHAQTWSKFLELQILPDTLTLRSPPAQGKKFEQRQEETASSSGALSRKGYMEKYGGISAVKGNLETVMVNPFLGQRRKLSPERDRDCPKATQPVSCRTETHPTSSSSQPLVAFTWPHGCPVGSTLKARR